MKRQSIATLVLLAALWGGSFPLMRVAVPEFGPLPLMALRSAIGAAVLLPMLILGGHTASLRDRPAHALVVGVLNSAVPFALFAWAQQFIPAGLNAILNATTPFWAALVAWFWFGERIGRLPLAGMLIGFSGVLVLIWERASLQSAGSGWAIVAALAATLHYGLAANYSRRFLVGANPIAVATASQLSALGLLSPGALVTLPQSMPSTTAWIAVGALGVLCTGIAYALFYWLIEAVGAARATTVTFLVPLSALVWGNVLLGEQVTLDMALGGLLVLTGTALTLGLRWGNPLRASANQ